MEMHLLFISYYSLCETFNIFLNTSLFKCQMSSTMLTYLSLISSLIPLALLKIIQTSRFTSEPFSTIKIHNWISVIIDILYTDIKENNRMTAH